MSFLPINIIQLRFLPGSITGFFAVLSIYFFLRAHHSKKMTLYLCLSSVVACFSFFVRWNVPIIILFFYLAYMIWNRKYRKEYLWIGASSLACVLLYGLFLTIFTGSPLSQIRTVSLSGDSGLLQRLSRLIYVWDLEWFRGLFRSQLRTSPEVFRILLVGYIIGAVFLKREKDRNLYIPVIWFAGFYIYFEFFSQVHMTYHDKHLAVLMPPLLLILARILYYIDYEARSNTSRVITGVLLTFFCINSLNYLELRKREDREVTLNHIVKTAYKSLRRQPRKNIYSSDYMVARKLNFYFNNESFKMRPYPGKRWEMLKDTKDAYFVLIDNDLLTKSYRRKIEE